MKDNIKKAIKEYQCSGCINGYDPVESDCFKPRDTGCGCGAHRAGTFMLAVGKLFLGMPKGFNRLGKDNDMHPYIFDDFKNQYGEGYDKFNVPVWKYLDKFGNTIVRGLQPRLNLPFLHIHLGNHMDEIDCVEITNDDIKNMDRNGIL